MAEMPSGHRVGQALWRKVFKCILKEYSSCVGDVLRIRDGAIQKRVLGLPADSKLVSCWEEAGGGSSQPQFLSFRGHVFV